MKAKSAPSILREPNAVSAAVADVPKTSGATDPGPGRPKEQITGDERFLRDMIARQRWAQK